MERIEVIQHGILQTFVKGNRFTEEEKQALCAKLQERLMFYKVRWLGLCSLCLSTCWLLISRTVYLISPFPILPNGSHSLWMEELFSEKTGNECATGLVILVTLIIFYEMARAVHFSMWRSTVAGLAQFPLGLLIEYMLVAGLACAACIPGDFALPAQWALWWLLLTGSFIHVGDDLKDRAAVKLLSAKHTTSLAPIVKPRQPRAHSLPKFLPGGTHQPKGMRRLQLCSVCQQTGLSEQCSTCTHVYQCEKQRVNSQLLRANQAGVSATLTLTEWLLTLNNFHWQCAYCQTGPYDVMEHYIPITQGGGTTSENCVPACYGCNNRKSNTHPESTKAEV